MSCNDWWLPRRPYRSSRLAAALVLASLFVLSGCPGVGAFTITRSSSEKTVEGSLAGKLGAATPFQSPFQFDVDLERELEKRNADGAKGVYLQKLEFKVTDDDDNFDFLDSVTFYANTDGEEREKIAVKDPVPEGQKSFLFDVRDNVNLKPYVEGGLDLESEVEGTPPAEDRSFKAVITLRIETL